MTKRILKYNISLGGEDMVEIPVKSVVRSIQIQDGALKLWAEVDDEEHEYCRRFFRALATGFDEIPDNSVYITTVQLGWTVWHIYETHVDEK